MRKSVFGVSDQVRHKPSCAASQKMARGLKPDIGIRDDCTIYEVKTKH